VPASPAPDQSTFAPGEGEAIQIRDSPREPQTFQLTCSLTVRCESPPSASGSGSFSRGTRIWSKGRTSMRQALSTMSSSRSSIGACVGTIIQGIILPIEGEENKATPPLRNYVTLRHWPNTGDTVLLAYLDLSQWRLDAN